LAFCPVFRIFDFVLNTSPRQNANKFAFVLGLFASWGRKSSIKQPKAETRLSKKRMKEMNRQKMMALVAHDNMKHDLAEWVDWNCEKLSKHRIVCTGTTGKIVEETLLNHSASHHYEQPALDITRLKSGPLGGDQQLGALIADERISALIFFWDPMSAQPHDVDVKALLRLATLYNVPTAVNRSTADFLISSPLFEEEDYTPVVKDYTDYIQRSLK